MPADELDALYADSRIVVNTLPAVRFGVHERTSKGAPIHELLVGFEEVFAGIQEVHARPLHTVERGRVVRVIAQARNKWNSHPGL